MRILIIEDNKRLAESIKDGLRQEGFAADCLFDGKEGQERILMNGDEYDLVILDLMLPGLSGLAVCENIRKEGIDVPIIMLTAKSAIDDRIEGLNCGADDYLSKPFSFDELLARIRALLRRPRKALPQQLKTGELVMDVSNKKVYRDGKEIRLSLKEFSLLEYLMRNPNQVLSREQILDHVWDFAFDSFSNVVDAHIKNLRKKIDHGYPKKILETIRGLGYRLRG